MTSQTLCYTIIGFGEGRVAAGVAAGGLAAYGMLLCGGGLAGIISGVFWVCSATLFGIWVLGLLFGLVRGVGVCVGRLVFGLSRSPVSCFGFEEYNWTCGCEICV